MTDIDAVAEEARQRFVQEMENQKEKACNRPREQTLPRSNERMERAVESVIAEAVRIYQQESRPTKVGPYLSGGANNNETWQSPSATTEDILEAGSVEVEVEVKSIDACFTVA